jgi:hypothetical protein
VKLAHDPRRAAHARHHGVDALLRTRVNSLAQSCEASARFVNNVAWNDAWTLSTNSPATMAPEIPRGHTIAVGAARAGAALLGDPRAPHSAHARALAPELGWPSARYRTDRGGRGAGGLPDLRNGAKLDPIPLRPVTANVCDPAAGARSSYVMIVPRSPITRHR